MAWPPQPPPAPPRRPGSVGIASGLLLATMLLALLEAGITVWAMLTILGDEQSRGVDSGPLPGVFIAIVVIDLLLAIGLAAAAVLTSAGRRAGSVLTWVFGGLTVLMRCACGSMGTAIYFIELNDPDMSPFEAQVWSLAAFLDAVALVTAVAAMVLLATASARRYVRR